ncbi:MAG TPA: hypothetical protein VLV32_06405 [Burkholderiales bacterium]|nr:hypothetical protein [Burkholderiales bacterium]
MVKHKKLSMAVAGAFALCGASAAHAFNVKAGDWDLSFSGEVNAFYTYTHCDNNANVVVGGLACAAPIPSSQGSNASQVNSGLLPSAFVFSAKTMQEGFDIGITAGFYPGISNSPGNSALSLSQINMRQNFLTFGDKDMGTFKFGRDLGLFASDAILSDMTLLGVGGNSTFTTANAPGTTTLGRIGFGYIYADWIPQITYISPSWDGAQVSAGIFQPLTMYSGLLGGQTASGHTLPMFQAKGTYDFNVNEDIKSIHLWVSGMMQRSTLNSADGVGPTINNGFTALAGDMGIKGNVYGFEPVIYFYQARGVGTTCLFCQGIDAAGNKRNSDGGYIQVQHAFGKWKPGFSYGFSRLTYAADENAANAATLVNFNRMRTQMLQYSLTKSITLVEEYDDIHSSSQATGATAAGGGKNASHQFSLGAILFF